VPLASIDLIELGGTLSFLEEVWPKDLDQRYRCPRCVPKSHQRKLDVISGRHVRATWTACCAGRWS